MSVHLGELREEENEFRPSIGMNMKSIGDEAVDLSIQEFYQPCQGVPRQLSFLDFFSIEKIKDVIKGPLERYRLPMVQFWVPCCERFRGQGRGGYDADQNECFSTVDSIINPEHPKMRDFIDDRGKHHLLKGRGVVGKAFDTNHPWISTDISSLPTTDYPLSDDARMLGLRSAIAIPLKITSAWGISNYVLEFFLPLYCEDLEEQKETVFALIGDLLREWSNKVNATGDGSEEFRLYLEPLMTIEQSGENDSLFIRGKHLMEDQNEKCNLDPTLTIELTEVGQAIDKGSFLSLPVSETSEERHATGDKTVNVIFTSVKDATKSTTGGKKTRGGGKKRDWAWKYCSPIEGNSNGVKCSFCELEIKGGGITRFKSHISGSDPSKNAKKCKMVSPEANAEIEKKIKRG